MKLLRILSVCLAFSVTMVAGAWAQNPAQELAPSSLHQDIFTAITAFEEGTPAVRGQALAILDGLGVRGFSQDDNPIDQMIAVYGSGELDAVPPMRGSVTGPRMRSAVLGVGQSEALTIMFYAGELAEISVQKSGAASIIITAHSGKKVCQRSGKRSTMSCRWAPPVSQTYTIRLQNTAAAPLRYTMLSN